MISYKDDYTLNKLRNNSLRIKPSFFQLQPGAVAKERK
jgi:hypothetical protein